MNTSLRNLKNLPSPKGKPIVGHLLDFNAQDKHNVLENWVNEVGDVFKISLLGKHFVVSANPEINLEILKNRPGKFQRFYKINEILTEMGVSGVFNAEGEQWKKHRALTAEALNVKNVRSFFPTLQKMTKRLHSRWTKVAERNSAIDVQKEMIRYTVDITTNIAFGYDVNTLEKDGDIIQNHLDKIFPMINSRITAPVPMWRYLKSKKDKELDEAIDAIETLVNDLIAKARDRMVADPKLEENPTNFLEALLVEQKKDPSFTDKEVFGNVFTILLAGEDTTSNSNSWTIFYLAQHPDIYQKVREEAKTVFPDTLCANSHEEVAQLKYTEAVCMEAIRMKPVSPNLYMQAKEDVIIQDLELKKGTTVMMQNKVGQTSEEHFSEADTFLPERWLPTGCPHHTAHSPNMIRAFGAGPRFCPGKNLAIQEMKIAISMICKNFDLTLAVKPEEVKEVFTFTMFPEGLVVKLKGIS